MRYGAKGLCLLFAGSCVAIQLTGAQTSARQQSAAAAYGTLCASCHGDKLQGGRGPGLLDPDLADRPERITNAIVGGHLGVPIREGESRVSNSLASALAVFIRERSMVARATHKWTFNEVDSGRTVTTEHYDIRVQTVVTGLDSPWSIAFVPDGRLLVTEKIGRLRLVDNLTLVPRPIEGLPKVAAKGQGGLMDVAIAPDYAHTGWIYVTYAQPGDGDRSMTALARGRLVDGLWLSSQTLFQPPDEMFRQSIFHFGSAIAFDASGHVYFTIGDRGFDSDAQDLRRPNGKIHRLNAGGGVPNDNPFPFGVFPSIWTLGHRNPQGLAVSQSGELWAIEHGPRGGDELNIIAAGGNYGWPYSSSGLTYTGKPIGIEVGGAELVSPVHQWTPSITPSSIAFYTGDRFPRWKSNLLVGSLTFQDLRRLEIREQRVLHEEILFSGLGRVRDIAEGPDGNLYVALNQPDRIARITLVESGARSPKK